MESEEKQITLEEAKRLYEGKYLEVGTAEARQTKYLYVKEITDATHIPGKFIFKGMEMTLLFDKELCFSKPESGRIVFGKDFVLNLDMHDMSGNQITITDISKERFSDYYHAATGNFLDVYGTVPGGKTGLQEALEVIYDFIGSVDEEKAEACRKLIKEINHTRFEQFVQ